MPRAMTSDFLQGYNFWAQAIGAGDTDYLAETDIPAASGAVAGFQNITLPDVSTDAVEYREGHRTYTIKQPGIPTVGTCSMQRGTTLRTSAFWDWANRALLGDEYRADLVVYEFPMSARNEDGIDVSQSLELAKVTTCFNSFPTRCKPGGDKDSTSGEISMAELECAVERVEVKKPAA